MKRFVSILALIASAPLVHSEEITHGAAPVGPAGGQRGGFFEMMDENKDGKVTTEEYAAAQVKREEFMFTRLDKNGDGVIGKDEFPQMPKEGGPGGDRPRILPDMSAVDKDGNGSVSKEEFAAAGKQMSAERFKKMDKNGDGVITKDEVEAARAQFGGHRGPASAEGDKK